MIALAFIAGVASVLLIQVALAAMIWWAIE